jgi:hypothetical protein
MNRQEYERFLLREELIAADTMSAQDGGFMLWYEQAHNFEEDPTDSLLDSDEELIVEII